MRTKTYDTTSRDCVSKPDKHIKYDDVYEIVAGGKCQKTGLKFDLTLHPNYRVHPFAPSIDRVSPKKGYVRGNTQIVVWAYNSARN